MFESLTFKSMYMELKKSKKAQLDRKRLVFLQLGLIVSISLSLVAFEWRTSVNDVQCNLPTDVVDVDEPPIQLTHFLPKPPPPPPVNVNPDVLKIVKELPPENVKVVKPEMKSPEPIIVDIPDEPEEPTEVIGSIYLVGKKPVFPGCEGLTNDESFECFKAKIMGHVQSELKYPDQALELGLEGKVYVAFVINKEGRVTNVEVPRSVDKFLDAEAIRVIKTLPKMEPATQMGKPVAVTFALPLGFNIQK